MSSSAKSQVLNFLTFSFLILSSFKLMGLNSKIKVPFSNGAIAYAYPINSIVIDGDTTDWPDTLKKHPIAIAPYGDTPKKEDFQAYFQVGHNLSKQAMYMLITVIDDNHVVDYEENANWTTQDSYALYVDYKHDWDGSGVNLFQFGENFKREYDYSKTWDPEIKDFSWDKVIIKMSRKGNTTIYEVKIDLGENLKLNKSIGIDHVLVDKDPDDDEGKFSFISWGQRGGKSQSSTRLGDIIPVAENTKTVSLQGKLTWTNKDITVFPDRVALVDNKNSKFWTLAEVDSLGNYSLELPLATYIAKPFWGFRNDYRIDHEKSVSTFKLTETNNNHIPDLVLEIKTVPDLIMEKGMLPTFDPNNPSEIDNFITAYQNHYYIPGVSLVLIRDGKIIYHKTYGNKNLLTKEPVNSKTLFEAASITKPVFAFAVCRLAETGIIDLDKPLYTYLPFDDIAHDERYKLITARHVLTHQTGFPNWARGKIEIKFTPGTAYGYSGEGFEYLKRVVSKITGKDVETIVKEEVLDPLGIKNTYFTANDYMQEHVSNGHYGRFANSVDLPSQPGMAWSMHTEAMDFSNFALGLMERKILKTKTYEDMFKIHTIVDDDDIKEGWERYFGLGISMEKTPFGPTFGHGGNNGDFKCKFKIFKDLNMGYIIFTNSDRGDDLFNALEEYLITGKSSN